MQQHGSKYFARRPPTPSPLLDPGDGLNMSNFNPHYPRGWCQNSTFSEHGNVAYQIKDNCECSNMVANIFPADPLPLQPHNPTPDTRDGVNMS